MKQTFALFILLSFVSLGSFAQQLSFNHFKQKKQLFITQHASLSQEEAEKFFPLYFELQDAKRKLNEESLTLIRRGKESGASEAVYEEIIEHISDNKIRMARLEKSYLEKFRQILSYKQLFLVQEAEMHFHRKMLKGMQGERPKNKEERRKDNGRN
ncbi:MAG: hypothetical protein SPJ97_03440 [Bacteroides sp.]|nr:hypothetical protein [Bacteroides sp.]